MKLKLLLPGILLFCATNILASASWLEDLKKADTSVKKPTTAQEEYAVASAWLAANQPLTTKNNFYDAQAIEKLGVISELAPIFKTTTIFGKIANERLLSDPVTSPANIPQDMIKMLVNDAAKARYIQQSLDKIAQGQALFLSCTDTKYQIEENILKMYFFGSKFAQFNNNTLAHGVKRTGLAVANTIMYFVPFVTFGILSGQVLQKTLPKILPEDIFAEISKELEKTNLGTKIPYDTIRLTLLTTLMNHNPYRVTTLPGYDATRQIPPSLGDKIFDLENLPPQSFLVQKKINDQNVLTSVTVDMKWKHNTATAFTSAATLAIDLYDIYRFNQGCNIIKLDNSIFTNLQTKLIGTALVVEGLHDLYKLNKYQDMRGMFPEMQAIVDLFEQKENKDLNTLIDLLQTNTFKGEASFFSNSARILAGYSLLKDNINSLSAATLAAGKIDAFAAVATLVKKRADKDNGFCFAEFTDTTHAFIDLQSFWNPVIKPDNQHANTITLGDGNLHNLIVTGPNGSGKSVFMKSIALNIVLAQTYGIAAADHAVVTPVDCMNVYLNVTEDATADLSTFMAERKQLDHVIQSVVTLPAHKKCFTLVDEPIKGTHVEVAEQILFETFPAIAYKPNAICLLATQHEMPTKLEMQTHGDFTNCYLNVEEPTEGTFIRTFTFTKGLNPWWFADQEKRMRFVRWISDVAINQITIAA